MRIVRYIFVTCFLLFFGLWWMIVYETYLKKDCGPKIKLGIDVLQERGFDIIKGKRVGILTDQAGVNGNGILTWQILKDTNNVQLKAIFAPVHGLEGKYMSLETFYDDEVDNIPIYSVFASNSRPRDEWLKDLDVVLVDLQGLGIRYYNYWAFMLYMMGTCFKNGVDIVVLDRPNPLGGHYVGGPSMDSENISIWGPVAGMPLFHGMTIGELARYCKSLLNGIQVNDLIESGVLHPGIVIPSEVLSKGNLTVIPMQGWRRNMRWEDTGLKWTETSPNIANLQSAYEYAFMSLGIFASINYGFDNCNFIKMEPQWIEKLPFHSFTSKYIVAHRIIQYAKESLQESYTGFSLSVNSKNRNLIDVNIEDLRRTVPAAFGLVLLALSQEYTHFYVIGDDNYRFLGTHFGDGELLSVLASKQKRINIRYFIDKWKEDARCFVEKTKDFYLYD